MSKSKNTATEPPKIEAINVAPRDSDIYLMGRRHAAYMLNHSTDTDALASSLLEIRARESEIARRVDRQAADAYIYGFEEQLCESNPALAHEIL